MSNEKFPLTSRLLKLFLPLITIWFLVLIIEKFNPQAVELQTRIGIIVIAIILIASLFLLFKRFLLTQKEIKELLEKDEK